jgi:FMN phosphatase YigB (HAD superfamily)
VAGARNAGLRTAWLHRPARSDDDAKAEDRAYPDDLAPPDITIASLTELLDILGDRTSTHEGTAR